MAKIKKKIAMTNKKDLFKEKHPTEAFLTPQGEQAEAGYQLSTEMEWMFAAMGGIHTHGYTYSGSNNIDSVAWFQGNSGGSTHFVGTKSGNEIGCFDMSGNVSECVWD